MTDQTLKSRLTTVANLNETPLSLHLLDLLKKEKAEVYPDALIARLALDWAMENRAGNPHWAQAVTDAAGLAEQEDPAALYAALEQSDGLMEAGTMQEVAKAMIANFLDLMPPSRTTPA